MDEKAFVYRNNSETLTGNNYLKVQLRGSGGNTQAIGSKVTVRADSLNLRRDLYTTRGFHSSVDPSMIFGLGGIDTIAELKVIWPDGRISLRTQVPANRTLVLDQSDADAPLPVAIKEKKPAYFTVVPQEGSVPFAHRENRYNDFKRELLLPHMLSTQGPKLAVADVDGDGLQDVFVGGAKDQAGGLFLQRADGSFAPSNVPLFQRDAKYEDVGAVFFDANRDGLPDLYVVSGSNEYDDLEGNYTDRLYLNMGQGRFANNSANLPPMDFSGSCAVVGDVDG